MLYLHGNCINEFNEIAKLKLLHNLKHLTFHGNPISNHPRYRGFVVAVLPQVGVILKLVHNITIERARPEGLFSNQRFCDIQLTKV